MRYRPFAAAKPDKSYRCSPMIPNKQLLHLIFLDILVSICKECFLRHHIREEEPMDSPVARELVQFRKPRNVCRAACCPRAMCSSFCRHSNGAFAHAAKIFSLCNDVPSALAVFVELASTNRASGRDREF